MNVLAKGQDFFDVGDIAISPDSRLMAWAEDTVGRRQYVVKVMDLKTRTGAARSSCPTSRTTSSGPATTRPSSTSRRIPKRCWASACAAIRLDSANHTDVATDPVVWTQEDESFYTQLYRTKDEKYLLIHTQSTVSTEVWYADAAATRSWNSSCSCARERDHEYQVEHANDRWIVRTNWQAKNFRIVERAERRGRRTARNGRTWSRIATTPSSMHSMCSRNFLTIEEHSGGLRKLRMRPWTGRRQDIFVTADEPSYTMALDVNREFDSDMLRYTYHVDGDAAHHLRLRASATGKREHAEARARAGWL